MPMRQPLVRPFFSLRKDNPQEYSPKPDALEWQTPELE